MHKTSTRLALAAFALVPLAACGPEASVHIAGHVQTQAQTVATADGLEARLLWTIPGAAAADGEIDGNQPLFTGYQAGGAVALHGEFPAAFQIDVAAPPPEAFVTRDGGSWAEGGIMVSTPAALDALEHLEAPTADTPWGGASAGVIYVKDATAEQAAVLALQGLHAGFNFVVMNTDALACDEKKSLGHRDGEVQLHQCVAACADDACETDCQTRIAAATQASLDAITCPDPLLTDHSVGPDSLEARVSTFSKVAVTDYDGDGVPDVLDPTDDSTF